MVPAEITFELAPWSDAAAELLRPVFVGKGGQREFDGVRAAIERGDAQLWAVMHAGDVLGVIALAVKRVPVRELVVLGCATRRHCGLFFGKLIVPILHGFARDMGATAIRADTGSPAVARLWRRFGFRPAPEISLAMVI
jgi:hypothetical protein